MPVLTPIMLMTAVAFAVPLTLIDLREHRLPNRLTLPLFGVCLTLLAIESAVTQSWPKLGQALLGALALAALYGFFALIPGGMGLGDVKLALSLGLITAWFSWSVWMTALLATFVVGGVWALVASIRHRSMRVYVPFGPSMIVGSALALLAGLA